MKAILIISLIHLLIDSNPMHQDTLLRVDKNGQIIGLPKEYRPANFDLDKKYLRIKDKEIVFPECFNQYFNYREKPSLTLSASWYHSKVNLPYYLNFDILPEGANYGYTILIDLETLELIHARKSIRKGDAVHSPKMELDESCLQEYESGIRILN